MGGLCINFARAGKRDKDNCSYRHVSGIELHKVLGEVGQPTAPDRDPKKKGKGKGKGRSRSQDAAPAESQLAEAQKLLQSERTRPRWRAAHISANGCNKPNSLFAYLEPEAVEEFKRAAKAKKAEGKKAKRAASSNRT